MAIAIDIPSKSYAALLNTDGVPLSDLQQMVGDPLTIFWGSNGDRDLASLFSIARPIGTRAISVADHDILRVTIDNGDDYVWELPVQDFTGIPTAASAGDTLVAPTTAIEVAEASGGNTILVGRTDSNVFLMQVGTYAPAPTQSPAPPSTFRLVAITHNEGLVRRRIDPLRNHVTRQVVVHRHSATRPVAPTSSEVTFDGFNTIIEPNSEWTDINTNIVGSDPLWIASREFQYISILDRWIGRSAWSIHLASSSFRIQYSSTADGPWVDTDPGTPELWVRYRLDDGTWATHQTRVSSSSRSWSTLAIASLRAGQVSVTRSTPTIDPDDFEWFCFTYQEDPNTGQGGLQGNIIPVTIPTWMFRGGDTTSGELQQNSLVYTFPRLGPGSMVRGDNAFPTTESYQDWYEAANASEQRGHITYSGPDETMPEVNSLRWFRGYSGALGVLILRAI